MRPNIALFDPCII